MKITKKEKMLLEIALDHISEATGALFETETIQGQAAAFMADNLIKYLQVIYRGDKILDATCDYEKYEQEHYEKYKKKKSKKSVME